MVRGNIYPVPDIDLPFLGVHLTRVISGEVYVGPTAIPALGRENYGVLKGLRIREFPQIARHMLGMYLRNHHSFRSLVHAELQKYRKSHFMEMTRRLVPALTADDLVPSSKVGIRPQLVNIRKERLEMDYIIEQTPNSMHVLNAISPAFTSAFAFAELLVDRLKTVAANKGVA
jgi:L-2-hydroxyglutarate oxidase LhgO